jgi:hypothetical protein
MSNKKVTKVQEIERDMTISCGINPKVNVKFMAKQVASHENFKFICINCKNYLKLKKKELGK